VLLGSHAGEVVFRIDDERNALEDADVAVRSHT
jgi:hypothetical protein